MYLGFFFNLIHSDVFIFIFKSTLFLKGSDKLNSEFKTILDKYNTPMLPVVLLDLINLDGNDNIFFFN
jgi:hypothetical protein